MQISKTQGSVVKKVLRDKEGRLVHATFYVYHTAGRIRARVLEWNFVQELTGKVAALFTPERAETSEKASFIQSSFYTFFTQDILYSYGSKARAPTV